MDIKIIYEWSAEKKASIRRNGYSNLFMISLFLMIVTFVILLAYRAGNPDPIALVVILMIMFAIFLSLYKFFHWDIPDFEYQITSEGFVYPKRLLEYSESNFIRYDTIQNAHVTKDKTEIILRMKNGDRLVLSIKEGEAPFEILRKMMELKFPSKKSTRK